ncbi:MAG: PAS domain S-box protein [Syntrophobacteraceae bacterium]
MAEGVVLCEIVYGEQGMPVDYRLISANPSFEKHTGLKSKQVLGELASKICGLDEAPYLKRFALVASSGQPDYFEIFSPPSNRHLRISVTSPQHGQFVTVLEDITESKQAEARLRESEEKYRLFVETALEGIWARDAEHRVTFVNQVMCDMFGYSMDEMLGLSTETFIFEDDLEDWKARKKDRKRGLSRIYECRFRRKTGKALWARVSAKALVDKNGGFQGSFGMLTDITERKQAEEDRERVEAQLRQAQKMEAIGALAGGIAHDLNNILQPIIGYTEMALNNLSESSPLREGLEQVRSASLRAKELIRQILAVSRFTVEQQRIPIDISSIIKEAMKLLRSSLPTSLQIRQDVRMGTALADPTQIHQVLMNLCTNAAHAMGDKGIMEVRLVPVDLSENDLVDQSIIDLKPGPYLELSVSDTGSGMDLQSMERIFDPYFTTKDEGKGSGLGLAVVHGIVRRHDGALSVTSAPGKGSTFRIYIPRMEKAAVTTMEMPQAVPIGTERILLVDDEHAVVGMGTAILERLGYKVTSETDSLRALEIFRAGPNDFELIITDYTMPKLTGVDLAEEVRRIRPDVPIIICTGFIEEITSDRLKELRMEFLTKPYGMKQIAEIVRRILDVRKRG